MKFFNVFALIPLILGVWLISSGKDSRDFSRLINIMKNGMTGAENVSEFDSVFKDVSGNDQHNAQDKDVANSFYNLASEFYEYGWGDSFHFGFRQRHEPHWKSTHNSQAFVAQRLQVSDGSKVLDLGCGIGGPLRGIVRMTGANITGLTINEHQVKRAYEITSKLSPWMQERCHYDVQDYHNVQGYEENSYDAAFYMESSLHTIERTKTFKETFRLLKPGGRLVAMEYVTLPDWNPKDLEHQRLMRLHLHGNGAARTPSIEEDLQWIRDAGFEIEEHFDYMTWGKKLYGENSWEWWQDLQFNYWPALLPAHPWIRGPLPKLLSVFSAIGLVPGDVPKAAALMNDGGDGLSGLGKVNAITPQYYVLGIKPMPKE
jgi:sterol 24-C-methyltransferase